MTKKHWPDRGKKSGSKSRRGKIISYTIMLLIIVWFGLAWYELIHQFGGSKKLISQVAGFSDEEKREAMFGEFYRFIELCRAETPPGAKIFLTNPTQFYYFFSSYYLYPREIVIAPSGQVINGPEIESINFQPAKEWLLQNGIQYQILCDRARKTFRLSKVKRD